MTTSHTPGPWLARMPSDGMVKINATMSGIELPATINNARLIAAAPDMLEALRECMTDSPGSACYNTGKKTRRLEAINAIVMAALAKAGAV